MTSEKAMSVSELEGYHGEILRRLKSADAKIGDIIRITTKTGEVFEGALFPRSEYGDPNHIVIKLRNGYNIGIHYEKTEKIQVVGEGQKPHFTRPSSPPRNESLPRVAIISTGGTIASRVDYRTGAVQPALTAADLASVVPELSSIAEIEADILFSEMSENVTTSQWKQLAEEIARKMMSGVKGVVVSQGTDTMHYTAAALSFALQNLPGPVLLVGAQRSSDRPSSDAASNLTGAIAIAAKADLGTVGVTMHLGLSDRYIVAHRGTRVRKCHTSRRDAFKSINSVPLARYDLQTGQINYAEDHPTRSNGQILVNPEFDHRAYLLKFHPGFNPEMIDAAVNAGARGIVLEGTGLGHVSKYCYESIKKAVKNNVPVFMTSQTIWGRVDMSVYVTGRDLLNIGVVPLEDMIPETALVKLMWTLAQTRSMDKVRQLMLTPVAGEITSRTSILEEA
jgi:glutamyl-tRNA(Gln) amidotransferase subunit D